MFKGMTIEKIDARGVYNTFTLKGWNVMIAGALIVGTVLEWALTRHPLL